MNRGIFYPRFNLGLAKTNVSIDRSYSFVMVAALIVLDVIYEMSRTCLAGGHHVTISVICVRKKPQ